MASRRKRSRWSPDVIVVNTVSDDDVVCHLDEYFKDFKTNMECNRFDKIDTKIPHLIIGKFVELFNIWGSNNSSASRRYLQTYLFENVYNVMSKSNVFKTRSTVVDSYDSDSDVVVISNPTESDDCVDISSSSESEDDLVDISNSTDEGCLECDECGEEIILRNNNREYSIAYHKSSLQHVECVSNLARIRNQIATNPSVIKWDVMWQNISKSNRLEWVLARFKESPQYLSLFLLNESFIEVHVCEEEFIRCTLCSDIFHSDSLVDHLKDESHDQRKLLATFNAVDEVEDINGEQINYLTSLIRDSVEYTKCNLCMITTPNNIPTYENGKTVEKNSHLQDIDHLLNLHTLNVNKSCIEVRTKRSQILRCTICDEDFQLQYLMLHLYSFSHYKKKIFQDVDLIDLQKEVDEMDIDLIDQIVSDDDTTYVKCSPCKAVYPTTCFREGADSHKRDDEHLLNLMVVHANRCFIRMYNKTVKLIGCLVCDEIFHVDSLMYHLNIEKHQKSKMKYLR